MRRILPDFDLFTSPDLPHKHARELRVIDRILCDTPAIAQAVWDDLQGGRHGRVGRPGISADQILRMVVLKQMNEFSYGELPFRIADSRTYLKFCGFTHPLQVPKKSAIHDNIKRISPASWEKIHGLILRYASAQEVEDGQTVRIDPTVVSSNIHYPMDNSLLYDGVRTLAHILARARESFGIRFRNSEKRAKRQHLAILGAKRQEQRIEPYQELLHITRRMIRYAETALAPLRQESGPFAGLAQRLADQLEHFLPLVHQVVSQTERRVLNGESVPQDEKLVSIFEEHTDIIRKDNRNTYYGHKVTFTGGKSGLVLDWVVEEGNPNDSTLFLRMLDRQNNLYGRYPRQTVADGCLATQANVEKGKERGVTDVVFSKKRGIREEDMASSTSVYRALRNFRAGVEAMISFLKRVFGLRRCSWKGATSFRSYVGASVVSANLLLLARRLMA